MLYERLDLWIERFLISMNSIITRRIAIRTPIMIRIIIFSSLKIKFIFVISFSVSSRFEPIYKIGPNVDLRSISLIGPKILNNLYKDAYRLQWECRQVSCRYHSHIVHCNIIWFVDKFIRRLLFLSTLFSFFESSTKFRTLIHVNEGFSIHMNRCNWSFVLSFTSFSCFSFSFSKLTEFKSQGGIQWSRFRTNDRISLRLFFIFSSFTTFFTFFAFFFFDSRFLRPFFIWSSRPGHHTFVVELLNVQLRPRASELVSVLILRKLDSVEVI